MKKYFTPNSRRNFNGLISIKAYLIVMRKKGGLKIKA
jgi:hypothetical protein